VKKLAVLATALALVLSVAAPALAQEEPPPGGLQPQPAPEGQDEVIGSDLTVMPASEVDCSQQAVPQVASQEEMPAATNPDSDGDSCTPVTSTGNLNTLDPACAQCGVQVAQAAQEAITGSDTGPSPTETFSAALQAARDAGSSATREAIASEETGAPVEETAAYQAAFEAATEAGADDETAKETAKQAVADLLPNEAANGEALTGEASKTSKVRASGSGESIAAAKDKTSKDKVASKDVATGEETTEEETASTEEETASTEETTDETTDDEVVATSNGEDGGSGGENATTTPAGSRAPLLLGGIALLSVGGYAGLRFARSWPLSSRSPGGRRLLGN